MATRWTGAWFVGTCVGIRPRRERYHCQSLRCGLTVQPSLVQERL